MRFYLHDRNNVPEREKITYYSNAEGDLIKEDLPQNLKSAKETLFREGSGGHEFLVTFMGKEYISIENSFSSDNQEYLNLDFEPHMFFEYGVDNPNVSLAYNKAVRNALALKLTKEFEDTILIIERSLMLELYKTYYKKEYKQLRRFKTLDINDLEALTGYSFQDCENTGEYIYASICYSRLIYIAKYVLKIELNTSVLISLKMIKDIYEGIEWEEMNYPDWDAIPEGELIHKCLEATNALGMGDSLYDHFDEKEIPEIEDDTERLRKELEIVLIQFGLIIRKMDCITDGLLYESDQHSEKAKGSHADSKQKKRDSNSKNAPQPSHDQVTEQEEEIQELKKKLAKTEQDAAYLGELYEAEKKKNSETVERLETAETEHLELIKLREEMYRMTEAAPESVANTSMEEKEKVLSCYKIAIIGGHDNWTYKLKNKFKNWKFYRPEVTRTIDEKSLQTADYIYFFTDIMSHGSYCRYIKFVREYGLKFGYLHTINIESNINQIYEDIQNLEK